MKPDPYLSAAIAEARMGLAEGGIPIGSVLVKGKNIVGHGHNRRVQNGDPMAHAEIDCLKNAGRIGSYKGTTLYSTLMPCYLCAGAVHRLSEYSSLGVCVERVEVKFEPSAQATTYFKLPEGAEVRVLRRQDGWAKIARPDGKIGWAPANAVEKI